MFRCISTQPKSEGWNSRVFLFTKFFPGSLPSRNVIMQTVSEGARTNRSSLTHFQWWQCCWQMKWCEVLVSMLGFNWLNKWVALIRRVAFFIGITRPEPPNFSTSTRFHSNVGSLTILSHPVWNKAATEVFNLAKVALLQLLIAFLGCCSSSLEQEQQMWF